MASRKHEINRRSFLKGSAIALSPLAFPTIVPSSVFGANAPSNQLNMAMMGVGNRGSGVMGAFMSQADCRLLAVCDPFRDRRERAAARANQKYGENVCKAYADYREVMARDDIDGVAIATPDHWHVPLAIAAAKSGKDLYVEKPLGLSVHWHWELRKIVKRNGNIFQYGTQQRSASQFRLACELVRNQVIGELKHIDVWCVDGRRAKDWMTAKSTVPEPVPDNLDYDLWLGPAPVKPYNHYRVHREGAFHTYDYAIGFIAGWGAHPLDIAQWGMDCDDSGPVHYEGTGTIPTEGLYNTINQWNVKCRYANGVTMNFMEHSVAKPGYMKYRRKGSDHGTTFFGTKGWVSVDRGGIYTSDPSWRTITFGPNDVHLYRSPGQQRNLLDCMKTRAATVNPLESAIRSDTISHLSDIAIRTGRAIEWDPKTEQIAGDEQATRMLSRPMRAPYQF